MAYIPGDHNVICDFSGFKIKRSQARKMWDGSMVRWDFWESRHPQDFVRSKTDRQRVEDARPEGSDTFLSSNEVTPEDL